MNIAIYKGYIKQRVIIIKKKKITLRQSWNELKAVIYATYSL